MGTTELFQPAWMLFLLLSAGGNFNQLIVGRLTSVFCLFFFFFPVEIILFTFLWD